MVKTARKGEPKWVADFIAAVYPEAPELIRMGASKKQILMDAANLINELRDRVKWLEAHRSPLDVAMDIMRESDEKK